MPIAGPFRRDFPLLIEVSGFIVRAGEFDAADAFSALALSLRNQQNAWQIRYKIVGQGRLG